jgi:hypothetical protein
MLAATVSVSAGLVATDASSWLKLKSVAAVPVMSRAPRLKVRSWIAHWIKTRMRLWKLDYIHQIDERPYNPSRPSRHVHAKSISGFLVSVHWIPGVRIPGVPSAQSSYRSSDAEAR